MNSEEIMQSVLQWIETFIAWLNNFVFDLSRMLAEAGVPEQYQQIGALGLLYVGVTLVVLVVILVLLSALRKPEKKRKKLRSPKQRKSSFTKKRNQKKK